MPTGYVAMLDDDPDMSTSRWVMEDLSRAFGVCIVLRDHSMNLTEEQVEKALEKELARSTKYHRENLDKSQAELDAIEAHPDGWDKLYTSAVAGIKKSNRKSKKEAKIRKLRHEQVAAELTKLRDGTVDEITRNIAQYGLDQLELCRSETEPHIRETPTLEEYKTSKFKSLNWTIDYHTKHMQKTEVREGERILSYRRLRYEVGRILEGKE